MAHSATSPGAIAIRRERGTSQSGSSHASPRGPEADGTYGRSAADLQRIAREEHLENIARSRLVWSLGVTGATGMTAIEIGYSGVPDEPLRFFAPRLLLIAAPALAVLRCPEINPVELRTIDATVYATAAATLALIAAQTGGFESHAVDGVGCLIVAQGLTLLDRPLQTAFRLGVTLAVFAAVVTLILALGPPEVSGALRDPAGLGALGRDLFLQAILAAMVIAAAHTHWSARRARAATRNAGQYILQKCIGKGGMGEVWLAHLPDFQRDVAVKLLRCDVANPQSIARFGREVAALAELRHPNTVHIIDWGVSDSNLYYAMELLSGETLKALVLREGPLPPARAVAIAGQVARALAEAHERGIIHRDVKPDNLFVTGPQRDFIKVLDFGVAKINAGLPGDLDSSLTRAGMIVGTAGYMAPEQVLTGPITSATDIYALGAVLFFMLTGRAPFTGPDVDVIRAQVQTPPPPVASLSPHTIPAALAAAVHRCLAKAARSRFASMLDLDNALRAALLDATPADPAAEGPPTTRRQGRARRVSMRPTVSLRPVPLLSASLTPPTVRYPKELERTHRSDRPGATPSVPPV